MNVDVVTRRDGTAAVFDVRYGVSEEKRVSRLLVSRGHLHQRVDGLALARDEVQVVLYKGILNTHIQSVLIMMDKYGQKGV